jgi:hypothetical protein
MPSVLACGRGKLSSQTNNLLKTLGDSKAKRKKEDNSEYDGTELIEWCSRVGIPDYSEGCWALILVASDENTQSIADELLADSSVLKYQVTD